MTVNLAHFSDTHGLPRKEVPDDTDVIVLSGDICPNRTRGLIDIEIDYQEQWLRKTAPQWRAWSKNKPIALVPGNHDFFPDIAWVLRALGVNAFDVSYCVEGRKDRSGYKPLEICGLTFFGLPDIPWMGGEWNHEHGELEISSRFEEVLDTRPDVVVSHCPPYGVLDNPFDFGTYHIGSSAVATLLGYHEHEPKAYLCGHCHERGGRTAMIRSTIVSNAAASRVLLKI